MFRCISFSSFPLRMSAHTFFVRNWNPCFILCHVTSYNYPLRNNNACGCRHSTRVALELNILRLHFVVSKAAVNVLTLYIFLYLYPCEIFLGVVVLNKIQGYSPRLKRFAKILFQILSPISRRCLCFHSFMVPGSPSFPFLCHHISSEYCRFRS